MVVSPATRPLVDILSAYTPSFYQNWHIKKTYLQSKSHLISPASIALCIIYLPLSPKTFQTEQESGSCPSGLRNVQFLDLGYRNAKMDKRTSKEYFLIVFSSQTSLTLWEEKTKKAFYRGGLIQHWWLTFATSQCSHRRPFWSGCGTCRECYLQLGVILMYQVLCEGWCTWQRESLLGIWRSTTISGRARLDCSLRMVCIVDFCSYVILKLLPKKDQQIIERIPLNSTFIRVPLRKNCFGSTIRDHKNPDGPSKTWEGFYTQVRISSVKVSTCSSNSTTLRIILLSFVEEKYSITLSRYTCEGFASRLPSQPRVHRDRNAGRIPG